MKVFFIILSLVSFLQADEMKRIESIVEDITKLRIDYEKCQERLKDKKVVKTNIVKLKKDDSEIQYYKKLLKAKDNEIINLKNRFKEFKKNTIKKQKSLEVCLKNIDDNPFPKLMPKENVHVKEEIQIIKASTFHLIEDAKIYDAPNGDEIDFWTIDTSFTSTKKTTNWIKVTGYFVNKQWTKAEKEMWIKYTKVSVK
jgi:regulator of replication initiation timing